MSDSTGTGGGAAPRFGLSSIVSHPMFGRGRVVAYERDGYLICFKGGETKTVGYDFAALKVEEPSGDPELDRVRQAVAEVLGDHGWLDADLEMNRRWQGGTLRMIPGKEGTQEKDLPLEQFFGKIIGVREKLRVLEQKINNHAALSDSDKVELQGYITRCYGSLTTFNVLFADKKSQFKGQGKG